MIVIEDKKLLLRVMVKLMMLVSVLLFAYVMVVGILTGPPKAPETITMDVSKLAPGQVRYLRAGSRWYMVIYRREIADPEEAYVVLQGQDNIYGCQVMLEAGDHVLRSVCADVKYDLDGRLLQGTRDHEDLRRPVHQWVDQQHVLIHLDE